MEIIKNKYINLCNSCSDINEHLPTLYKYAKECESIVELGVRGCVSSWAFVYGLLNNESNNKKIVLNDIQECDISELLSATSHLPIDVKYYWVNDLNLQLESNYDMVFIDTWHIYGQLKRELEKFSKITNKYIIMHDTEIDQIYGESVRMNSNIEEQMILSGYTRYEITVGLGLAIEEFLDENPKWILLEQYTNNNGLTILKRIE